jgi:hypothetical protein
MKRKYCLMTMWCVQIYKSELYLTSSYMYTRIYVYTYIIVCITRLILTYFILYYNYIVLEESLNSDDELGSWIT